MGRKKNRHTHKHTLEHARRLCFLPWFYAPHPHTPHHTLHRVYDHKSKKRKNEKKRERERKKNIAAAGTYDDDHLGVGDGVGGHLDDGEVALANRLLELVVADLDELFDGKLVRLLLLVLQRGNGCHFTSVMVMMSRCCTHAAAHYHTRGSGGGKSLGGEPLLLRVQGSHARDR